MILIDANLLIYAYDQSSAAHQRARLWIEEVFSSGEPVRLAWSTLHAFLRITTHSALFRKPFPMVEAKAIVEEWLAMPSVTTVDPGPAYWQIFSRILLSGQVRGPLVMDAHLAALAIENGAMLCTTDRDFGRFEGLRFSNPIAR